MFHKGQRVKIIFNNTLDFDDVGYCDEMLDELRNEENKYYFKIFSSYIYNNKNIYEVEVFDKNHRYINDWNIPENLIYPTRKGNLYKW